MFDEQSVLEEFKQKHPAYPINDKLVQILNTLSSETYQKLAELDSLYFYAAELDLYALNQLSDDEIQTLQKDRTLKWVYYLLKLSPAKSLIRLIQLNYLNFFEALTLNENDIALLIHPCTSHSIENNQLTRADYEALRKNQIEFQSLFAALDQQKHIIYPTLTSLIGLTVDELVDFTADVAYTRTLLNTLLILIGQSAEIHPYVIKKGLPFHYIIHLHLIRTLELHLIGQFTQIIERFLWSSIPLYQFYFNIYLSHEMAGHALKDSSNKVVQAVNLLADRVVKKSIPTPEQFYRVLMHDSLWCRPSRWKERAAIEEYQPLNDNTSPIKP